MGILSWLTSLFVMTIIVVMQVADAVHTFKVMETE